MKINTIHLVLAAVTATVASSKVHNDIHDRVLNITLAPHAVDTLKAHGLWAPDPESFARGHPNVDNFNATAENIKFEESGLDISVVATIGSHNKTTTADGGDKALANTNVFLIAFSAIATQQLLTLDMLGEEACMSVILCLACWIICEGACQGQGFCKDNGCD
ncbi:hypothetical protein VM1G_04086 [Cytospora mali]|uniref:Uncharacterized protein n=1 Tax=Cytospora mali TaxID=578113 RepID=A0A194VVN1_CYTMA|nr:hypothetical protein VM1G_04086 [Valsa mali]